MNDEQLATAVKAKMVELLDDGVSAFEVYNAMTAVLITGLTEYKGPSETARILRELAEAVLDEGNRYVVN